MHTPLYFFVILFKLNLHNFQILINVFIISIHIYTVEAIKFDSFLLYTYVLLQIHFHHA